MDPVVQYRCPRGRLRWVTCPHTPDQRAEAAGVVAQLIRLSCGKQPPEELTELGGDAGFAQLVWGEAIERTLDISHSRLMARFCDDPDVAKPVEPPSPRLQLLAAWLPEAKLEWLGGPAQRAVLVYPLAGGTPTLTTLPDPKTLPPSDPQWFQWNRRAKLIPSNCLKVFYDLEAWRATHWEVGTRPATTERALELIPRLTRLPVDPHSITHQLEFYYLDELGQTQQRTVQVRGTDEPAVPIADLIAGFLRERQPQRWWVDSSDPKLTAAVFQTLHQQCDLPRAPRSLAEALLELDPAPTAHTQALADRIRRRLEDCKLTEWDGTDE
jgi:hypothetical protein